MRRRAMTLAGSREALALAVTLLMTAASATWAQGDPPLGAGDAPMSEARMVMPTDDAKVFRLVRPSVAALQTKLAVLGLFEGRINGLYGPTTRAAVREYQTREGLEPTGLPTCPTIRSLRGLPIEPSGSEPDRSSCAPSQPIGETAMQNESHAQMEHGAAAGRQDDESGSAGPLPLSGDPSSAKTLMLMEMPGMKVENDHTRAVRAVRELLAGLGLPQRASGPQASGPDFATALSLFHLEPEAIEEELGDRIDLETSPVSLDRELMLESSSRYGPSPRPRTR